jgi:GNAT superfamily N-acetyltransferase
MFTYRTFRNTDPPVLTAIWRSRSGQRGLAEPVSADLFEQIVFARLYFDYGGLIVARDDDRPVGFAHAGFGPDEQGDRISTELGVTCVVIVRPDCPEADVAAGLLERCEQYLRGRGAKVLYGGGIRPLNPFYLGLYGGSELPGVLDSDLVARELYGAHGYREIDQTRVLHCRLSGFQAAIDRRQMQIRRQMIVEVTVDPPARTWWEACTLGDFDLTRFELVPRGGGAPVAWATFRSMEPSGVYGAGRAAGLIELEVEESLRRRGLAVFLLSEAFRQFVGQGILLVEAQVMQHNAAALGVYAKLGFQPAGYGSVFRKE